MLNYSVRVPRNKYDGAEKKTDQIGPDESRYVYYVLCVVIHLRYPNSWSSPFLYNSKGGPLKHSSRSILLYIVSTQIVMGIGY